MIVKVKTIFFGCCGNEQNQTLDVIDVDNRIQLAPRSKKHKDNSKSDTDTATDTHNHNLTTSHSQDEYGNKAPILKLTVIEGDILPLGKEFMITSKGLEFGGRRKMDGCIHIGRHKLAKNSHIVLNDIVLEDPSVGEKHCMIKYNANSKRYAIKDQGDGSGTFVKVEGDMRLKSGFIISFGDSHVMTHVDNAKEKVDGNSNDHKHNEEEKKKEEDNEGMINLKFLDGPKSGQVLKFKPKEEIVKVGRLNDCQVKFEGNNLSRHQCSFKYINGMWYISDGFEKPSTNGTWIFLDHFYDIVPGSVIKIGQTLFKADLLN